MHKLSIFIISIFFLLTGCSGETNSEDLINEFKEYPALDQNSNIHSIEVNWTSSTDSKVFGYYIYYGTMTGKYSYKIWSETTTSIINITGSGTYYFSVTAVNTAGESTKSYDSMISI